MNQSANISRQRNGMLQGEQVPIALRPDHFQVDERDTARLLDFVSRLASVLHYYSPSGNQDGTWDTLLLSDVTMLTARIMQYSGNEKYHEFLELRNGIDTAVSGEERKAFLENMFRLGFEAIRQVNEWYTLSGQNFSDSDITTYLRETIRTPGRELLNSLYGQYNKIPEVPAHQEQVREQLLQLDAHWKFSPFVVASPAFSMATVARSGQLIFNWLDEIVTQAKVMFYRSLQRQDVPPHLGLLLTFLDLFKHEQQAINTITSRHLDFYYKTILRAQQQPARPDQALITLTLAKGVQQLLIPSGSLVDGGKDAQGLPVLFSLPTDTLITDTQISDYLTLTFPAYGSPSLIAGNITNFDVPVTDPWPLFGAGKAGTSTTLRPATVGFAVSCADLLLGSGTRKVTLSLQVDVAEGTVLNEWPTEPVFDLSVTTPQGWFPISKPEIIYGDQDKIFTIIFSLRPSDPALVPYTEKLHGAGFDSIWPICQVRLTDAGLTWYDELKTCSVTSIHIITEVNGLSGFVVENDSGKLPSGTPFSPFNVQAVGNSLYLGGQELAVKQLQEVTLTITWENLPPSLKSYYQAYNDYFLKRGHVLPVFQNQSFTATASVLTQGQWVPAINRSMEKPASVLNLFTDETHESLIEKPVVKNNQKKIVLTNAVVEGKPVPLPYRSDAPPISGLNKTITEGFYCLTLTSPAQGFGNADYPNIVSEVTLANSEILMRNSRLLSFKKKKTKPLPHIPYLPRIKSLAIDYRATQQYDVASASGIQWYHLHPFGIRKTTGDEGTPALLPVYQQSAYIYFSFQQLIPNTDLTFCFVLDNTSGTVSTTRGDFTYEYLSSAGWKPLSVLSDSTGGFQCTGILRVAVPSDAMADSTEMPASAYWFRLGTRTPTNVEVRLVATQAMQLQQQLSAQQVPARVAAGAITRFVNPMPGIRSVMQPISSSGGSAPQTEETFRQRVANRIRCKNRITSAVDLEMVLLSEFPQLFRVTAIPVRYAGDVIRVVIVPFQSTEDANPLEPYASAEQLEMVLNFLTARSMMDDRYEIENPVLRKLQVSCQVVFLETNQNVLLLSRLNTDINHFLSPWLQGQQTKTLLFNSSASAQALYSFIRSLPYVKGVSNFQVVLDSGASLDDLGPEVLVVPALRHAIQVAALGSDASDDDALCVGKNFYITP
jgi:hypothetical protein